MNTTTNQSSGQTVLAETAEDSARLNAAMATAAKAKASRAARAQNQRPEDVREREAELGGARLQLHVMGTVEGYHLYWENDQNAAIEQLLMDGFEFVSPEEVSMQRAVVSDGDVAHRVSRYVGTKSDNSPMRAYLMKCTDELWAEREARRYRAADTWDNQIRKRADNPDAAAGEYKPKGVNNAFNTRARIDLTAEQD